MTIFGLNRSETAVPIKQRNAITKLDFEESLNYLGETVSGIAKQTGIPRAYLSDLKNRNVPLARAQEDKLRTYLDGQGVEFDDAENASPQHAPASAPQNPASRP